MTSRTVRNACLRAILVALFLSVDMRMMARAGFELPSPTGSHAVATTSWRLVDDARLETFSASGEPRSIEVFAWYPAAAPPSGDTAPYLREGLVEVRTFARLLREEAAFDELVDVRTHAAVDGAPAESPAAFPVLLFSHGYTGIASSHTALFEDLASHGYIVLSIVHSYEVAAATVSEGRVVTMVDDAGGMRQGIREVFGEWKTEDDAMASVTSAANEAGRLQLLRAYLSTLSRTNVALRRWVDDTRLVLDRLPTLMPGSAAGRVAARIDPSRIGVLGHSMGGVTAGQFCVEDRRCRAGLNLDGIPQYGTMIDRPLDRPFLMVYSARPGRVGASDAIYRQATAPYYRVDVRDSLHLEFTDMVFWGGPLRARPMLGAISPVRVTEITRTIVREFFDQELKGRRSTMLNGVSPFPEVTVTRKP